MYIHRYISILCTEKFKTRDFNFMHSLKFKITNNCRFIYPIAQEKNVKYVLET